MIKLKDYYLLIALLLISFISVYFLPAMLSRMIFLFILVATFRTKIDYVYLVWFFIINDAPGRLFSAGEFATARIPLYPVTGGISISFQELFLIVYIIKYLSLKNPPEFIFKQEFTWYLIFGVFVVGYSFFIGMDFDNMIKTFRFLFPWSLIFILPTYIYSREIFVRVSLLLFPMVFLAFFSQIFCYITGSYFDDFLRSPGFRSLGAEGNPLSRNYSAIYLTLFSIIQAFYLFLNQKNEINKKYLGSVIFICFFTVLLTATRGWIIALSMLLLSVLFLFGFLRKITRWIRLIIVSAVVFGIIVYQFPVIQRQLGASFQRLTTLEAIAAGDLTAEGTLKRINVRAPRVMDKFWESPVVGWGFSDDYYNYDDAHVGHNNILLNIGIFGYLFINGLFLCLCMKIWRLAKRKKIRIYEGNAPLIYALGLIAVFVIHSSSTQLWGYTLSIEKISFFSFLFASANSILLYRERSAK